MPQRTSSSIHIAASAGEVMAVIADFPRYPQWADGIKRAEVAAATDGRADTVRFRLDAGVLRDDYTLAYTWHGDDGVDWELSEAGTVITGMSGSYVLRPVAGGTDVDYALAVDVRIPLPGMLKRRAERTIISTALSGLRKRVEGGG